MFLYYLYFYFYLLFQLFKEILLERLKNKYNNNQSVMFPKSTSNCVE